MKNLRCGAHSQAQLVLHLQTGELRVRKVSVLRLKEEDKETGNREKVLFYLQDEATKLGVQPHIAHLISLNDVPAGQFEGKETYSRVSYMKYYNGGDMGHLYKAYNESGQAMPSSLILRLLRQAVSALYFTSTCDVLHADLHDDNFLIHHNAALGGRPDFYIGDWGAAERGALTDPMNRFTDDVEALSIYLERWLYCGSKAGEGDELWRYLDGVVHPAIVDLSLGPAGRLPDLRPLLDVLREAPAGPPETLLAGVGPRGEHTYVPLSHETQQNAFCAPGVAGPWHLAQVSIDRLTGHATVVSVSSETYDNPLDRRLQTDGGDTLVGNDQETVSKA